MTLIAVPFNLRDGDERKAARILDGVLALPNFFPLPGTQDERRLLIAGLLTNGSNRVWEVWNGGEICGIFILTAIAPRLDGEAHFAFFDRQLLSRRTLILNMLGKAFPDLELERITVELPEHLTTLIRFARTKLGFRYEGEAQAEEHFGIEKAAFVAKLGSRRERSYWRADKECWVDTIRLRLLRTEYERGR